MHERRRFAVTDVGSVGELAVFLTEHSWTLCTGFRLGALLFLNDSFSEDGAQEFAVVRGGRQIESVTVSWQSRAEAHNTIASLVDGGGLDMGPCEPRIDETESHWCPLCA